MPDPKKPEPKRNMGASVRARLLAISKANGRVFDLVLNRYALERLLNRLSVSAHARRFVLKGANLLMPWLDTPHRGTRDLDLLGFGDHDGEEMLATEKVSGGSFIGMMGADACRCRDRVRPRRITIVKQAADDGCCASN